jgi:hypothetical protein
LGDAKTHSPAHSHSIVSHHPNYLILLWKIFFKVKNTVAESGKNYAFEIIGLIGRSARDAFFEMYRLLSAEI